MIESSYSFRLEIELILLRIGECDDKSKSLNKDREGNTFNFMISTTFYVLSLVNSVTFVAMKLIAQAEAPQIIYVVQIFIHFGEQRKHQLQKAINAPVQIMRKANLVINRVSSLILDLLMKFIQNKNFKNGIAYPVPSTTAA
ncbi:MAG: hypothetical protein EZS28_030903 [Streblomastix strix]|uniref:Uncharacterized protein n=1 Tax=Streblomastix strix TaxID=222440 RepID=A0A5J4UTT0_9EUKA|nr:MAG: hypothetical protein EZS28_030903 [Streblomastix strix]